MAYYFKNHPEILYRFSSSDNFVAANDITRRLKIKSLIEGRAVIYFRYFIKDGERPDVIASKYYDDPTLDWVILLVNEIQDPYFEWPMEQNTFNDFIIQKYGSVSAAQSQIRHYEKTLQVRTTTSDGTVSKARTAIVDYQTYVATDPSLRRIVDAYTYESELNEKHRGISILDKKYIGLLKQSHRKLING